MSNATLMGYGIKLDKPEIPPYYLARLLKIMNETTGRSWKLGK
jgi:hypothetical protein